MSLVIRLSSGQKRSRREAERTLKRREESREGEGAGDGQTETAQDGGGREVNDGFTVYRKQKKKGLIMVPEVEMPSFRVIPYTLQ